jgi:HK97 gp10 family phage protein
MKVRVNMYPQAYIAKMNATCDTNVLRASIFLQGAIIQSFGSSGVSGTRSGATKKERAGNRSKPFEPPHVDTGHLRRNIGYQKVKDMLYRIGTGIGGRQSVGYAIYLEYGTSKMAPRPYLRPAFNNNKSILSKMMMQPIK